MLLKTLTTNKKDKNGISVSPYSAKNDPATLSWNLALQTSIQRCFEGAINKWDMHPYLHTNQLNTITIMVMTFSACQVTKLQTLKNKIKKRGSGWGLGFGGSGLRTVRNAKMWAGGRSKPYELCLCFAVSLSETNQIKSILIIHQYAKHKNKSKILWHMGSRKYI